jgi:hypothetical protein
MTSEQVARENAQLRALLAEVRAWAERFGPRAELEAILSREPRGLSVVPGGQR